MKETNTTTLTTAEEDTDMELGGDGSGGGVAKRQREGDNSQGVELHSTEEPPAKAVPGRRLGFKPKSNVPPDRPKPPGTPT